MNVETVALAKTVKEKALKAARNTLTPGVYSVDCIIRLRGSIKVADDQVVDARTGSINYKAAFATVCGMLREQSEKHGHPLDEKQFMALLTMAMSQGDAATAFADSTKQVLEAVERKFTKPAGTVVRKGQVTTKLSYSIEQVTAEVAA